VGGEGFALYTAKKDDKDARKKPPPPQRKPEPGYKSNEEGTKDYMIPSQ